MSLLTCVMFLAEVRGYSRLYDDPGMYGGAPFMALSFFTFLFFTDMCIYWIHRGLHHRRFKHLHKLHHKWIIPTPFASHAFHPIDGFAQSFPYHVYPFLFPLHKGVYLGLFVFVNIWTVMIHDGDYRLPGPLQVSGQP
jgi:lathosterol oxidase